jgi:drug/metabolite transporter (DMT)-like permease
MFFALLLTFFKNIIYGSTVFFTGALSASVDVLDILSLRFLMSFLVLFLLKVTKILKIEVGIRDIYHSTDRHKYIKYLFITALFEPVLYMLFETLGISMTTGITAGVILSLNPISSCICEELILKEKSTLMQKVFLALGIVGVIYIAANTSGTNGKDTPIGILFIILAVICGSLFLVFSRKSSSHFSAFEITYFSSAVGAVAFNTINVVRHIAQGDILHYFDPYFDSQNMIGFVFLAIVSTIIATWMNNYALSKIQVSTSSAFSGVSTLITILLRVVVGGEKLYSFHIVGLFLIALRMVGVSYIDIKRTKRIK